MGLIWPIRPICWVYWVHWVHWVFSVLSVLNFQLTLVLSLCVPTFHLL